ncbi:B3/4 domain [Serratia liquefaciens]|uniref:B3/B4 domain-containing protein n=2 Tax=Serratia liquefaciens TaxID=614 RepID=UPI00217B8FDA|nr:phenylalanine--tRNA ligase beta subunit-related protein [Serratia liquefaciens]CAI1099229.1 B3/4 domain [Serratia liquefaciens]CAI1766280.1 B3/4 domain [Serratia liquefaciens]
METFKKRDLPMSLHYAPEIRSLFGRLHSGIVTVDGIHSNANPSEQIAFLHDIADKRLATASEGEFVEIKAWRRAYSTLGLKPTQYRCAAEALLRRHRKGGELPELHPLIGLCNAVSLAFAIPVAVFDLDRVAGEMTVRPANGKEYYESFTGETENPEAGEVIFVDTSGRAHARRWTHRQSGWSAVSSTTCRVMIVAEALHETSREDIAALLSTLTKLLCQIWPEASVSVERSL